MIKDEPAREFVPVLRPTRSHSFAGLLDGITLTVAAILIVVIFMAYMTHIPVDSGAGWRELGLNSALMYICTVSFYLLLLHRLIPLSPSLNSSSMSFIVKYLLESVVAIFIATTNGSIKSINILAGDDAKLAPAAISAS